MRRVGRRWEGEIGEKVTAVGLSGASRVENGSRERRTKVEKVDSARGTHPADTAADTSVNRRSVASVSWLG